MLASVILLILLFLMLLFICIRENLWWLAAVTDSVERDVICYLSLVIKASIKYKIVLKIPSQVTIHKNKVHPFLSLFNLIKLFMLQYLRAYFHVQWMHVTCRIKAPFLSFQLLRSKPLVCRNAQQMPFTWAHLTLYQCWKDSSVYQNGQNIIHSCVRETPCPNSG